MSEKHSFTMRTRRLKAVAVVLAVLVVAPGVEVVARIVVPSQMAEATAMGIDADALLAGGDAHAVLGRIEGLLADGGGGVPDWFSDEIGLPSGARDVRSNDCGSVVGYVVPGESSDVLGSLAANMESTDWTSVPLGEVEGATFVKSGGRCTWALVTCTQVGSDTSVVVRCMVQ